VGIKCDSLSAAFGVGAESGLPRKWSNTDDGLHSRHVAAINYRFTIIIALGKVVMEGARCPRLLYGSTWTAEAVVVSGAVGR